MEKNSKIPGNKINISEKMRLNGNKHVDKIPVLDGDALRLQENSGEKMSAISKINKNDFAPGFIEALEKRTGRSIESLRGATIVENREEFEKQHKRPLEIRSFFPLVGRGTVLHDRTISRQKMDAMLDNILEEKPKSLLAKLFTRWHG